MLHHVVYASTALVPFSTNMLYQLLWQARKANHAREITGILLYHNNSFLQLLEGPEEAIQPLFERIYSDPRHKPHVLNNWGITHRYYDEWLMSFVDPNLNDRMRSPDGYVPYNTILQDDTILRGIDLKLFQRFHAGEWSRGDTGGNGAIHA